MCVLTIAIHGVCMHVCMPEVFVQEIDSRHVHLQGSYVTSTSGYQPDRDAWKNGGNGKMVEKWGEMVEKWGEMGGHSFGWKKGCSS